MRAGDGGSAISDEDLARDAARGSSSAFAELIDRYEARVFRFVRRFGLSSSDAEDATQETFVHAWSSLTRYDPSRRFSAWLFTIAARRSASAARARLARRSLLQRLRASSDSCPPAQPVGDEMSDGETLWQVAHRLLGAEASGALWLRYVEGLSPQEIARVLGTSSGSVRVTLHRARRSLRAALGESPEPGAEPEAHRGRTTGQRGVRFTECPA